MADPQKKPIDDPYASLPDSSAQQDPYASMPDSSAPENYAAGHDNIEGTYTMQVPGGKPIPVPHSKVMGAYGAGYLIDPNEREVYAKYREHELKQAGKPFNPDIDVPLAFHSMQASPKTGTADWFKEMKNKARDKIVDLLPTAGGVAGGIIGGGAGLPTGPGDVVAATAGAAAGGGIGEAARQQIERHNHPYEHRLTPKETVKGIGEQAAVQGASELVGRGVSKAVAPVAASFSKAAAESRATGINLLPSEASGKAPSYIERLAKGHVMTAGKMENFRSVQNTQTQAEVKNIADSISKFNGTSEELGDLVQKGVKAHTEQFHKLQNKLYDGIRAQANEREVTVPVTKQVTIENPEGMGPPSTKLVTTQEKKIIDDVMPSTKALKQFAKGELKKLDQVEQVLNPDLLAKSRGMLEHLANSPDNVTLEAMRQARSDALSTSRSLEQALAGKESGLAKKMASLFDESMIDAADKSGIPDLSKQIREANDFTANEHRMFEQALVKKIVETKRPEMIATLLRGKTVGIQETRDMFDILPAKMHPLVQRQLLLDTMNQSTDRLSKVFNERKFSQALGEIGDERGTIIFGSNWSNVKKLAGVLERINGPAGLSGGGSGAAFQNIGVIKNILAVAGGAAFATGHPVAGTISEGLSIGGEYIGFRTLANALTHPDITAKLLKALQVGARVGPYAGSAAVAVSGGPERSKRKVTDILKEAEKKKPEATTTPGPQSSARPYTHVFDPATGRIVAA